MALSKSIQKVIYGKEIVFNNTYIKIAYLNGNKDNINFTVNIYDETRNHLLEEKSYSFIPSIEDSSTNIYKQIYEYLKLLEEFTGSTDILEDGQTT